MVATDPEDSVVLTQGCQKSRGKIMVCQELLILSGISSLDFSICFSYKAGEEEATMVMIILMFFLLLFVYRRKRSFYMFLLVLVT